jgi:ATP-dependent Clp protease protease subunit
MVFETQKKIIITGESMTNEADESSLRSKVTRKGRNIYFFDDVDEGSVLEAAQHVINLQLESDKKPITILINSAGGGVYDGLCLYDVLRACPAPIITIGMGLVASMAFIIYLAGDRRISTMNTRFMNHQISANLDGKNTDIKIQQIEMDEIEKICLRIISGRTGIAPKVIQKEIKIGDHYYSAQEAMKKGIVHEIVPYFEKTNPKIAVIDSKKE